jgi:hypothetical protein
MKGFVSIFTRPLKACSECGTVYTWEEELVAEGAVPTSDELHLANLRSDMANMRDSFLTVSAAATFMTIWMFNGPGGYEASAPIISVAIGVGALAPSAYFHKRVADFKKQIKQMRQDRIKGHLGS